MNINDITEKVIGTAINIHRELGPGLLESTYEACMLYDLADSGLKVENQKTLPIVYKNIEINSGYRLDLLVENKVIIELKSVEKVLPIHKAQLMSYLKLSGCTVGLLINFNVEILKNGIYRIVNGYNDPV
ncbi:GxxExxY protein [Candidatus Latescibacterota bacterium]